MSTSHVMIVEDEVIVAMDLAETLKGLGFATSLASSGNEAIAQAEAAIPDLVLMDIVLPGGMDGIETASRIRTRWDVPVIYLTAYSDTRTLQRAKITGPFGYLLKPFKEKDLLATIEMALYKHELERQLKESESRFREFAQNIRDVVYMIDPERRQLLYVNQSYETIWQRSCESLYKDLSSRIDAAHPEDKEKVLLMQQDLFDGRFPQEEYRIALADGSIRWIWDRTFPVRDENGKLHALGGIAADITERKRWEEEMRQSEDRYRDLVVHSQDLMCTHDLEGRILSVNPAAGRMMGWQPGEETIKNIRDILAPESRDVFDKYMAKVISEGAASGIMIVETQTGEKRIWEYYNTLRTEGVSAPIVRGIAHDVTERKMAEKALVTNEKRFRALIENSADLIVVLDADATVSYSSPSLFRILGYRAEEWLGKNIFDFIHPEDAKAAAEALQKGIQHTDTGLPMQLRVRHKDDTWRLMEATDTNLLEDEAVGGIVINARDITESKQLEEQLRHAQKMDAIGRLAGGIAHDFNNLLTAIIGYSQFALSTADGTNPLRRFLEEIEKAGVRAASLTNQLLAFSRRQVLMPRVLELNNIVADMRKMLRRLIGEDITLVANLGEGLGMIKADPGQIEQVIVNLAVNARDAMPNGGTLVIETVNVELGDNYIASHLDVLPGRYVMLAVSDTGTGMSRETLARLFEPFFTTKEQGKGTGLGLSTVYGIVKQSGGDIWVYSEPDRGTTFKVYLPRVDEPLEAAEAGEGLITPREGWETVLLAEDDTAVRTLAREVLEQNGYTVLEASDGELALSTGENYQGQIHLMITDVVMPQISGSELIRRVRAVRPDIKVLCMSGYTDDAIARHGLLESGVAFIQKPFSPGKLIRMVREVLGSEESNNP